MLFYHYTSIALVDGILRTDLSLGHLNMIGEVIKPVAWLTTDPKAEGHGMTTGAGPTEVHPTSPARIIPTT
jgi:hypothetical protein